LGNHSHRLARRSAAFAGKEPGSIWLDGTAILFRVKALAETRPLDDRLFAYYDDYDIGTRLARLGWYSRCVFDATVYHDVRYTYDEYPLYLVYLLQRNHMLFYYNHTPAPYWKMLYLRLVDKAFFEANRRRDRGLPEQGDMMLLAIEDFIRGRFGPHRRAARSPDGCVWLPGYRPT
jgi:GT2 family glycosyltransferase